MNGLSAIADARGGIPQFLGSVFQFLGFGIRTERIILVVIKLEVDIE